MSEVLNPPVTTAVDDALSAVEAAMDSLAGAELWGLDGQELTRAVQELHRVQCRAQAVSARLVAQVDVRGVATELGATSTAGWLIWALRLHPGAAKRAVRDARALHVDPAGPLVPQPREANAGADATQSPESGALAATRAAFAAGTVSGEQVSEIIAALDALPAAVDSATRARGEQFLVAQARNHGPHQLTRMGKHLLHTLDPDGANGSRCWRPATGTSESCRSSGGAEAGSGCAASSTTSSGRPCSPCWTPSPRPDQPTPPGRTCALCRTATPTPSATCCRSRSAPGSCRPPMGRGPPWW